MPKTRYFLSDQGCTNFENYLHSTDSALVGFLVSLTGWLWQNVLRGRQLFEKGTWLIGIRMISNIYRSGPVEFWRSEVYSDFVQASLLENLRNLQPAPVRAVSESSQNLYNTWTDRKRNSGILPKGFLRFSPKQLHLLLKSFALYLGFWNKYLRGWLALISLYESLLYRWICNLPLTCLNFFNIKFISL